MTTWFAQNSSVNIDSVNQWNSAANGSGSWLTWASLAAGDVLVANGKTSIAINVNVTCATMTNLATGGTASGGFLLAAGITVTANITSGTSNCITRSASGADSYIVGNVTGGSVNLGVGLENSSTGIVRITGNVTGGSVSSNTWGVYNTGTGHIYITGNVTCPAGNVFQGFAVYNTGTGNIYITGNVTGTGSYPAVQNNSTGRVYVTGNITGGSSGTNAVGIQNQSTGIVVVNGTITGGTNGPGYVGIVAGSLLCHTGDRVTGSGAIDAVCGIGRVRIAASQQTTFSLMTYDTSTLTETASRSLYTGGVNLNQPAIANVRSGTTYGATSEYTGTLAVPSPTLVAIGVATDNTVGSYSPTGGLDAAGVRSAIGLATGNLDNQLSGLSGKLPSALVGGRIDASIGAYQLGLTPLQPLVAGRQIAVAATTGAVELDSSARVKLAADQPDYVPATAAAVAAEAVKTAAIQTKTDNLPSDPADQSLIVAATDAVMTRLGAPAGASISADIAAIGGGGGGDATLAKQEQILEAVESVADSVAAYAARLALEVQLRGFPNVICRNADYLEATESEIRITIEDLTGTAITEIAGTPVASLSWLFGMGTEAAPNLISGTSTWDGDSDELVIEIPKASTTGKQTGSLTWQIGVTIGTGENTKTRWLGGGTTRLIERQF